MTCQLKFLLLASCVFLVKGDVFELRKDEFVKKVNEYRTGKGLGSVTWADDLAFEAQADVNECSAPVSGRLERGRLISFPAYEDPVDLAKVVEGWQNEFTNGACGENEEDACSGYHSLNLPQATDIGCRGNFCEQLKREVEGNEIPKVYNRVTYIRCYMWPLLAPEKANSK